MQASFTVENVLLSCRYGEIISNQKLNEMTIRKYGFTVDDPRIFIYGFNGRRIRGAEGKYTWISRRNL